MFCPAAVKCWGVGPLVSLKLLEALFDCNRHCTNEDKLILSEAKAGTQVDSSAALNSPPLLKSHVGQATRDTLLSASTPKHENGLHNKTEIYKCQTFCLWLLKLKTILWASRLRRDPQKSRWLQSEPLFEAEGTPPVYFGAVLRVKLSSNQLQMTQMECYRMLNNRQPRPVTR